jgi:hypothetical protein
MKAFFFAVPCVCSTYTFRGMHVSCASVRVVSLLFWGHWPIFRHKPYAHVILEAISCSYLLTSWTVGVRFPSRTGFLLCHRFHTGSGGHTVSYSKDTGSFSLRIKWSKHETDHSPPFRVYNEWNFASTFPILLHFTVIRYRENFTLFYFYLQ